MKKKHILLFLLIVSFVQGCKEKSSANGMDTAEMKSKEEPTVKLDTNTIYGYSINNYFIDSNVVQLNQGLGHLLQKYGISQKTIFKIASNFNETFDFRKIKPNKKYYMIQNKDSLRTPVCFVYELNAIEYVAIKFKDSINVKSYKRPISMVMEQAGGVIESSLWNALIKKDLSPALVMEVAKLYAWTIDFFGIQKGDSFKVIYEAKYVNNQFIGIGEIKAFLFNHRGNNYYSFRYEKDSIDEFGYFNEKGESMKKALLSAPLEYTRISSKFSNRRLHPITRKYRPHHGVDYAAPTGTDVVATGDGTVTFAATSGGAGKMIKIKHSVGNILTKYLHLSSYGKGIKKGAFVKQGQKIGEVGNTGMSTGPHLDYRIYINGKAVDPLGIDIPTLDPITTQQMDEFLKIIDPIKNKLDAISN